MSDRQQRIQAKIDEARQAHHVANPDDGEEPEELPPPAYALEPSASSSSTSSQPQASRSSVPSVSNPALVDVPPAQNATTASSTSLPLAGPPPPQLSPQPSAGSPTASGGSIGRSPSTQAPRPQVVLAPPGEEPSGLSLRDQKIMSDIMPDEPQEEPHPLYEERAGPSQLPPQGPYAPPQQQPYGQYPQGSQGPYASPPPNPQYSQYNQHQGPPPPGPSPYGSPYANTKGYADSPPLGAPGAQQWDFGQNSDKSGHGKDPRPDSYAPSPFAPGPAGQNQGYGYAPDKPPYAPQGQPSMSQQYPGYHFANDQYSAPDPSGNWEPRPLPQGSSRGSIAASAQGPPQSWNRLPAREPGYTYAPFPPLALVSHSSHLSKGFPEVPPPAQYSPHPFATHDVQGEDWKRFLDDIKKTTSAIGDTYSRNIAPFLRHQPILGPLIGLAIDGAKAATKAASKSPTPGAVVDDWNTFFFNPRRLNVSLLHADKRLSGQLQNLGYNDPSLTQVPSLSSSPSTSRGDGDLGRYLSRREGKRAARQQEKAETPYRLVIEPF